MKPLSETTRRLYLLAFVLLFLAILPVVIFYADGWRYKEGYGFVRTGGIFVSVPYPDAVVTMNGVEVGKSGFLARSFYISDLAPSAYIMHVEREGYLPWDRLLVVEEQLVTDSRALLIPEKVDALKLIVATSTLLVPQNSTTTRVVSQNTMDNYLEIFAATTTASTTIPVDEISSLGLFIEKGRLAVRWIQDTAYPPSQFCERPSSCEPEILLEKSGVVRAWFFRGGVVYAMTDGRVLFSEIDVRQTPVSKQLFSARGADIRIINDTLTVKAGNSIYQLTL